MKPYQYLTIAILVGALCACRRIEIAFTPTPTASTLDLVSRLEIAHRAECKSLYDGIQTCAALGYQYGRIYSLTHDPAYSEGALSNRVKVSYSFYSR